MLENELKNLWKSSGDEIKIDIEKISKVYLLEKTIDKAHLNLTKRNWIEYAAGLVAIAAYSYYFFFLDLPLLSKLGCVATILAVLFVCFRIYQTSKLKRSWDINTPVLQQLTLLKSYFEKEKQLLETIGKWYILPFLPGLALFELGKWNGLQAWQLLLFVTLIGSLTLFIWWINQRAAKKKLQPIVDQLTEQIRAWES